MQREALQREEARASGQSVEKILGEDGDITGRAEEARVAGDTSHAPRGWIMNDGAQHHAVVELRGGDAVAPRLWWKKARVLQTERFSYVLRFVLIEGETRELFNQGAEDDEVDIAVTKLHAGRSNRGAGESAAQAFLFAGPWIGQRQIRWKTGVVRKQLADRDVFFAVDSEFRQILCDRIVQQKAALLVELHHGGSRSQYLGQRGNVENGILRHRLVLRNE